MRNNDGEGHTEGLALKFAPKQRGGGGGAPQVRACATREPKPRLVYLGRGVDLVVGTKDSHSLLRSL